MALGAAVVPRSSALCRRGSLALVRVAGFGSCNRFVLLLATDILCLGVWRNVEVDARGGKTQHIWNLTFFSPLFSCSLGLISDSFHMFFDCTALLAGLAASVISKWRSNDAFSYGYVRAEVLAGFVNGLFLIFTAFFIFSEGVERALEPPDVHHDRLLPVSILGFIVNLIGIFVFQHGGHGHSHGSGHEHSHSLFNGGLSHGHGGHGHSHEHKHAHGHSHDHGHGHGHSHGQDYCHDDHSLDVVAGFFYK
ncbi:PREDICTED: zinc transporter 7-like, partial [Acanthisitta chloris]|uniref:zinc transporter 7-like n=1 Tax=Acanthisitta chloris TaxID=57068 RepID=UPI0004F0D53F